MRLLMAFFCDIRQAAAIPPANPFHRSRKSATMLWEWYPTHRNAIEQSIAAQKARHRARVLGYDGDRIVSYAKELYKSGQVDDFKRALSIAEDREWRSSLG